MHSHQCEQPRQQHGRRIPSLKFRTDPLAACERLCIFPGFRCRRIGCERRPEISRVIEGHLA